MTDFAERQKSEFGLGADDLQLSDYERGLAAKLFRPETMLQIDDRWIGYLAERLVLAGLNIPITQIQGFSGFTVNLNTQAASSSTSSTTYTDLADGTHPEIAGLDDGLYAIMFGSFSTGTGVHTMGVEINGVAPAATEEVLTSGGGNMWSQVTLAGGNNTLTAKYKGSDGSSVSWRNRYLFALKSSNT